MGQDPKQSKLDADSADSAADELDMTVVIEPEAQPSDLLDLAGSLHPRQKVSLIRGLITQLPSLELEAIQKFIEREEKERTEREKEIFIPAIGDNPLHRIKIKKDYNFKKLGLSYAQQYFVSIAQKHRIHSDIYLGVLFFVKEGYPLNYVITRQGVVQFDPATSVFQLKSSLDRNQIKFVRLVMLVPPLPDYDVTKIVPETILQVPCFLHVEVLNDSLQVVNREQYQFPDCMRRRQAFDRDYWDIVSIVNIEATEASQPSTPDAQTKSPSNVSLQSNTASASQPVRPTRVINQSKMPTDIPVFMINNQAKISLMTSFLRQVSVIAQKAFSDSSWQLHRSDLNYKLLHSSKKIIVEIRVNDQEVLTGDVPLGVLSNWCRGLGMAVSQNARSTKYTDREKEIARNLMLEFSAEVTDHLTFVEKFFHSIKGVKFKRKTDV